MKITAGHLVSLQVKMYDAQGELMEESEVPLVYLHGAGDIFPKIEQALEGQETGFATSVWLEPEDAFGDDDVRLLHLVALAKLGKDVDLGMQFEGVPGQPQDGRLYRVVDLTDDVAVLDGNHPLAGRALRFDVEVVGVEPATEAMRDADRAEVPDFLRVGEHGGSSTRH
ncbi:MAG: peptidylprolyl isomerase [Burkholderiales bacterium]|nr:peptidylprolyl isomerase [Burkholderiales bacterium]